MMSLQARLGLAALSGSLVWPLQQLPLPWEGATVLSGALFGALVLMPFLAAAHTQIGRALALVAGGAAIHLVCLKLAASLYGGALGPDLAIMASGLIGALLAAALTCLVVPLAAGWLLWVCVGAAGLAGGFLVARWGLGTRLALLWMAAYAAWQMLVCAALYFGTLEAGRAASKPASSR